MASTNKTPNYELSQFVETDRPAWLTDYNGDMRTLDTALKAVSDVASGASGSISSLTDRMTAAEGAISKNANDIDALEARADTLEAQAQSTAGTIAGIQTEQTAQNLGIEAATELGYNLARPYDSASTYAVGDYVLFQNTLYKCVTAVSTGEAFDPTKWIAIKATDEISTGGETWNETTNFITNATATGYDGVQQTLEIYSQKAYYNDKLFIFNAVLSPVATGVNINPNTSANLNFNIEIAGETIITPNGHTLAAGQGMSAWTSQPYLITNGRVSPSGTKGSGGFSIYNTSATATTLASMQISGVIIRK